MAYEIEKHTRDIVISGFETGVAVSPHRGIANIQNGNIATETGEVMASYGRAQNTMTSSSSTGALAFSDSSHVTLSISGSNNKFKGMWITVSSSSHAGELANGTYYVQNTTGANFVLATSYTASGITGYTAGLTAVISLLRTFGEPQAYTTETYFDSGVQRYRYYVLDTAGLVWVYDTVNDVFPNDDMQYWFLPDNSISYWGSDTTPSGLGVLNGWLIVLSGNKFWVKPTVNLSTYVQMTNANMMSQKNTSNPHFVLVGHQGRMYYTDGNFVGMLFPDTSLEVSGLPNLQSYASWTTSAATTGLILNLYGGSVPSDGNLTSLRVPTVFFPATGGTLPAALTANVVYYVQYSLANANFQVFAAATGGVALDISAGSSGIQYYNTFYPVGTHAGTEGDHTTFIFIQQRLTLPIFEVSATLVEVGNTVVVGTRSSVLYPWNQVDATPTGLINLPEANVKFMLNVNQIAYIFAGFKGNIYVTDGSVASLVLKLPDYCAGIAGTANSYIEPLFTWGGAAYVRGRVYFSALDQTSTKAGNCGGIWSFYPTQNLAVSQDTGVALRLENRNSYATYSGYATVIIPWFDQSAGKGPQYFSGWKSAITSPTYGIDKTSTTPVGPVIIETDLVPVGTLLNKYTPKQIEYKLASALATGESVAVAWRKNGTDAYTSAGNVINPDGVTGLAGYFNANFQGAQWVQLKVTLTPNEDSTTSFVRLSEIRMR